MLDKLKAQQLQKDFVPGGKRVMLGEVEFRPTRPDEVYQCCVQVGTDYPQSGPIYCGRVAEYVSTDPDGSYVALCGQRRHVPVKLATANPIQPARRYGAPGRER